MAAPIWTDAQQKTIDELFCSPDLTAGLHRRLTFLSVLNSFLSVTTFLGNALILTALHKESSLHPPSKLLLQCLATTDLCVGLIAEPLNVTYWMSLVNEHWNACPYLIAAHFITGYFLCGVSGLTLTAISVDRLLALLLGLGYRQVVTLKRTYMIVIIFWVFSTGFSVMGFWYNRITMWYSMAGVSLCLAISIFSYTWIFLILRHHQNQLQDHVQQLNQMNQLNI